MIVIGGTQRSGTSFLAKYLQKIGYELGTDFWDNEVNGGLESPHICNYYSEVLEDKDFPFSNYQKEIPIGFIDDYVIQKFSYILMQPKFVDIWHEWRKDKDKFLITLRDAKKVVRSKNLNKKRRKQFANDHYFLKQTPEELDKNVKESLKKLDEYNIQYEIIRFPLYLKDFRLLKNALKKLGVIINKKDEEVFNKTVNLKFIHNEK